MPVGTATININGPVVASTDECQTWPYTTLADVQSMLDYQAPYTEVHVTINSPGGNADEGFGIYDLLRSLPVPVTTEAVGQCSSIASIIFLAGTTRRAHKNLNYTVHFPFGGCNGTAAEMQAYTDKLLQLQQRLLDVYTTRGTVAADVIKPMLEADTALTTEQMLAFGLATTIVEPVLAMASFKPVATTATATPPPANPAGSNPPATKPMAQTATKPAGKPAAITAPRQTIMQAWDSVKALVLGTPMLALSLTVDSGAAITVDTGDRETPEAGDAANDADGNPLADGSYAIAGATLVVKDGKVESYTAAPAASTGTGTAPTATTVQAAGVDTEAVPATLEEATQIINALRKGNMQASTAPAPGSRYQQELQQRLQQLGSMITSAGAPPVASDTANPTLVNRTVAPSASADANSAEAKQAALENIRSRKAQPRR